MSPRRFRLGFPARELRLSGRWSLPLSLLLWVRVCFAVLQLALAVAVLLVAVELFV